MVATSKLSRRSQALLPGALLAAGAAAYVVASALAFASYASPQNSSAPLRGARTLVPRAATMPMTLENSVKTVAETLDGFYKAYPQPPLIPMYRPILVDLLSQSHIVMVDTRFKYDSLFALGLKASFDAIMGSYDRVAGSAQTEAIWGAFMKAAGLEAAKIKADAEATASAAKASTPAIILEQLEGGETDLGKTLKGIQDGLYNKFYSVGLFQVMELSGTEASKANVGEWAKALKVSEAKVLKDLDTYTAGKNKVQQAEEMFREIEIREKKKMAERLEEKANALGAKAAAKAAEA